MYLFCTLLTITAEKQRNTPNDSDADDEEEPSYCPCGAENSDDMIWCDGVFGLFVYTQMVPLQMCWPYLKDHSSREVVLSW